jgi:2-polyprenyl-3-methyl-5-hydroxy-6-metoxy-1,4-benzoquinol methylase
MLCGAEGRVLYRDLPDRLFQAPGRWDHRVCPDPRCGLVWLDPMPTPEFIGELYREYYTHETERPGERSGLATIKRALKQLYELSLALIGVRQRRRRHYLLYLDQARPGTLLEVGCGSGERLAEFRRLGWTVLGQEVDGKAAETAQASFDLPVHVGPLETLEPDEQFDAVIANHVIEHVHDPVKLIRQSMRLLRPGGRLVIATPNAASLGHRIFGRSWMALDPPRHLYLYSPSTLTKLARRSGLTSWRAWTSEVNAQSVGSGSLNIVRSGRHDVTVLPSYAVGLGAVLFQLASTAWRLVDRQAGEECVLSAEKPGSGDNYEFFASAPTIPSA